VSSPAAFPQGTEYRRQHLACLFRLSLEPFLMRARLFAGGV
jgi:hypothetical protein